MNRHVISLLLVGIFFPIACYSLTPFWIRHTPKAANDTYYYVVESATASTEDAARNKATALVLQRAIQFLGLPYTSKEVEEAVRNGKLESMAQQFKIPISKACEYRQNEKGGGVRVYVLYQVAKAGNITVQFTPYNNCGSQGSGDTDISMRPEEWGYYESDQYFSYSSEDQWTKGEDVHDITKALETEVRNTLIENFAINDQTLLSMIETKVASDNGSKTVFAIAYIEKNKVIETYQEFVSNEMEIADGQMSVIESRINEGDLVNAKSQLDMQKARLDTMDVKLNFLRAYASSFAIKSLNTQRAALAKQCDELYLSVAGNQTQAREKKIHEFVRAGNRALRKAQIADALRYFYGAQVLLSDLPNAEKFTDTVPTDHGLQSQSLHTYLPQRIKDILGNIQIQCDGFYEDSPTEIKLSFYYPSVDPATGGTTLKAISSLNYIYNDNSGWSELMPVKDGWSIISIAANTKPKSFLIRCEYRYEDEAAFDPELQQKIKKYRFSYDQAAERMVPFTAKPTSNSSSSSVNASSANAAGSSSGIAKQESTDLTQNTVAKKVQESSHLVAEDQIPMYQSAVEKVCDAIDSKDYQSVYTLFTADGYDQFERLIKYGNARIISRSSMRFVKMGTDIQCRYIPMEFVFKKGKREYENVIFTFNETNKIDGIQFALEERAARNIMVDKRYSETAKLVLVNFMENYKTAFALKRLDYIESIFADDAIIITGRVLKHSEQVDENQLLLNNVIYDRQSKGEYISRLRTSFAGKEWINIKFSNTEFEKSAQGEQFGIRLLQDYSSSNYGDRGNLFLLIDCQDQEHPLIRVRVWQAETGKNTPFTLTDYDYLTTQ